VADNADVLAEAGLEHVGRINRVSSALPVEEPVLRCGQKNARGQKPASSIAVIAAD